MADFLFEIGLDEIPARMIAGAEAELGRRVNDLLARERLLGRRRQADHLFHAAPPGRSGRGRAGRTGRHRRTADRPLVEGCLQGWRADRRCRGLCQEGRRGGCGSGKSDQRQGRVCRRNGEAAGPRGLGAAGYRIAQGSAGALLGQKYVLARGQAGAVCAAGALGCCAAGFGDCSCWRLPGSRRAM